MVKRLEITYLKKNILEQRREFVANIEKNWNVEMKW